MSQLIFKSVFKNGKRIKICNHIEYPVGGNDDCFEQFVLTFDSLVPMYIGCHYPIFRDMRKLQHKTSKCSHA